MKILCHFLFSVFFFLVSSFTYAETKSPLVNSIYFVELFIIGGVLLALILVFILMLKERNQRVKKIAQIYEDFEQKTSVMQMMLNSVHEKEKNIIKIVESLQGGAESYVTKSESDALEANVDESITNEKQDVFIDPRTLDVNGKVKQPHLGRSNYLLAMQNAHSQGLSCVIRIEDALQVAIADAVDGAEDNLQEIDSFYQKLSELIEALELEGDSKVVKPSSQNMIEALSDIQYDFEELMKHQKYNQSVYERLTKKLVEKPYNAPTEILATVLEN